jgi:3'(2'), 5'-bisphosphate nucleotidase
MARVVLAVREAGRAIMSTCGGAGVVQAKPDRSPLTEADLASHRILTRRLAEISPGLPIVSEEDGLAPFERRASWPAYWLIDPLDGTKEYLARNGEFTVNVALISKGRPTLGVVGVPARDTVFTGDVLSRVARRIDTQGVTSLATRAYRGGGPIVVASRRHGGDQLSQALSRLEQAHGPVTLRNVGSALKLCMVAEGDADLYPRLAPTSEWDTAAAHAVLEAAGGAVLQLCGTSLRYNKPDILNPAFVAVSDAAVDWTRWFRR